MKVSVNCGQCKYENGMPNVGAFKSELLTADRVIRSTCEHGHATVTCIENPLYQVLAFIGVEALIDGYYREAVMSFAAAYENLMIHFVEIFCLTEGVSTDAISGFRKVCNRSEKQRGAFYLCYLIATKEQFQDLREKPTKLRNYVAHEGKIPSADEAKNYAQCVIEHARPIVELLTSDRFREAEAEYVFLDSLRRRESYPGARFSSQAMAMPLRKEEKGKEFNISDFIDSSMQMRRGENILRIFAPFLEKFLIESAPTDSTSST